MTAETKEQGREGTSQSEKYKIIRTLNRGSFGVVNLVRLSHDPITTYACKQLPLDGVKDATIRKEV